MRGLSRFWVSFTRKRDSHAQLQLCAGFASEHLHPGPTGVPRLLNLHVPQSESQCDLCAMARSVTLACRTAVGTLPPARLLIARLFSVAHSAPRILTGLLGSRAPPLS